jgi:cytoskeleton protein RodZ
MPEIGQTLRETRMRNRIDITEVEAGTKIRAKYLRALENEEWDLLPGPTFVKTFLRTYAEFLGLDARLLVEEYKQRYERPSAMELTPFGTGGGLGGRRDRRRDRRRRIASGPAPVVGVVVLVVVVLLAALFALGKWGPSDDENPTTGVPSKATPTPTPTATARPRKSTRSGAAAAKRVSLIVVPTGTVNVCLVDASGKALIDNSDLVAGKRTRRFRSKRLRISFGNGQAHMLVNGRRSEVPDRSIPVGYELRPGRSPRELPEAQRPTCN